MEKLSLADGNEYQEVEVVTQSNDDQEVNVVTDVNADQRVEENDVTEDQEVVDDNTDLAVEVEEVEDINSVNFRTEIVGSVIMDYFTEQNKTSFYR